MLSFYASLIAFLTLATTMASQMPLKVDVHSHFLPDFYQEACRNNGHANPDGMPYLPDWNETSHLALVSKPYTQSFLWRGAGTTG